MSDLVTIEQVRERIFAKFPESKITDRSINDIAILCNRYLTEGKRPLYVYCSCSGSKCAMTAKALFAKRIEEYEGDIVCLMTTYMSRGCKPASTAKVARQQAKRAKQIERANKPKRVKSAKGVSTVKQDGQDPVEQPDPYQHYKIRIDGEWKYWWNDPKYQEEWRKSRETPQQFTLQDWIDMLKTTCHRVDISCAGPCNACPFVYACSCKCKVVVDRAGKKVDIDLVNMTTFDTNKADMDDVLHRLNGSVAYFKSLQVKP